MSQRKMKKIFVRKKKSINFASKFAKLFFKHKIDS